MNQIFVCTIYICLCISGFLPLVLLREKSIPRHKLSSKSDLITQGLQILTWQCICLTILAELKNHEIIMTIFFTCKEVQSI